MRSNNTFIFLIVAVVSFLVYWFFIRKKPDDISNQPSPGEEEPSLPVAEMQEIEQITNPDESVKKEEYAEPYTEPYTEYAGEDGIDYAKLSNNITATLKWKNKGGFQDVKQITLTHTVGTTTKTEVNKDIINKFDADGNEIVDNKKYFINRSGDTPISHTFDNIKTSGDTSVSVNLVGTNTFTVGYTLNNGDKGTLLPASSQEPINLVISEDQLRLSLELFVASSETYKPKFKSAFTSGKSKGEALTGTDVYFQWDWKSDDDQCYRRIGHMFSMDQIKIVEGADPTETEEKQGYIFQVILDDNRRAEAGAHYDATGTTDAVGDIEPQGLVAETKYYIKKISASTITTPEMVWLTSNVDNAQEFKFVDPPSTIKSKLKKKNYFSGGTDTSDSTTAKPTRFMFNKDGKDFYMGYSKGSANRSEEKNPDAKDKEAFHLEYFTLDMVENGYMLDCVMNTNPAERYKGHGCDDTLKNDAPKWGPVRHTSFSVFSSYKSQKSSENGDGHYRLEDSYDSRGLRNRIRYMGSLSEDTRPYVRKIKNQTDFVNN